MRLILIGPQGSGKGTQGPRLAARFRVPHVATGDLLRVAARADGEAGRRAKEYMDRGELVPDDVVLDILLARLGNEDAKEGFVLDGFPRTAAQADKLDAILDELGRPIDAVVCLDVPDELLLSRISARARHDDTPEAIRRRLQLFHEETEPLLERYGARGLVVHVEGVGEVEDVEERIAKAVEAR